MVVLRVQGLIGSAPQIFKAKNETGGIGAVQVVGDPLSVSHPGDGHLVVDHHRQGAAEAAGLVEFGQHHALGFGVGEAAYDLVEVGKKWALAGSTSSEVTCWAARSQFSWAARARSRWPMPAVSISTSL